MPGGCRFAQRMVSVLHQLFLITSSELLLFHRLLERKMRAKRRKMKRNGVFRPAEDVVCDEALGEDSKDAVPGFVSKPNLKDAPCERGGGPEG